LKEHPKVNNNIRSARDADRDKDDKDRKDLSRDINRNGRDISNLIVDLKKNEHDEHASYH